VVLCGWAERQHKVDELQSTFAVIKSKAESRQSDLEQTLNVAEKFWDDMNGALQTVKDLQDNMAIAQPPGLEPDLIREQQDLLEVMLHSSNLVLAELKLKACKIPLHSLNALLIYVRIVFLFNCLKYIICQYNHSKTLIS